MPSATLTCRYCCQSRKIWRAIDVVRRMISKSPHCVGPTFLSMVVFKQVGHVGLATQCGVLRSGRRYVDRVRRTRGIQDCPFITASDTLLSSSRETMASGKRECRFAFCICVSDSAWVEPNRDDVERFISKRRSVRKMSLDSAFGTGDPVTQQTYHRGLRLNTSPSAS
jgi:hypothetical protein